jgi:hypothetical protein
MYLWLGNKNELEQKELQLSNIRITKQHAILQDFLINPTVWLILGDSNLTTRAAGFVEKNII